MSGCGDVDGEMETYRGAHVRDDAVADRKVLYVLAHLDDAPDRFMSGDELMGEALE